MLRARLFISMLLFSIAFSEYEYSLEDINSSSEYYGEFVGTSYFPDQVTLHYFGHYN